MKQHEFQNESGRMMVSDPAYSVPTWCQGAVKVKTGAWVAMPIFHEGRVAALMVYHKETMDNNPSEWEELKYLTNNELPYNFGVDSGQLGFFDEKYYRDDNSVKDLPAATFGENYDKEAGDFWYRVVCQQTLRQINDTYANFGGIPTGCVSSSGWGDGSYPVYGVKMDDEYYGFLAEFIYVDGDIEEVTNEFGEQELQYVNVEEI